MRNSGLFYPLKQSTYCQQRDHCSRRQWLCELCLNYLLSRGQIEIFCFEWTGEISLIHEAIQKLFFSMRREWHFIKTHSSSRYSDSSCSWPNLQELSTFSSSENATTLHIIILISNCCKFKNDLTFHRHTGHLVYGYFNLHIYLSAKTKKSCRIYSHQSFRFFCCSKCVETFC